MEQHGPVSSAKRIDFYERENVPRVFVHTIFRAATFNYLATISTRSCFRVESSLHLSRRNGGVYGQSSTITLILHTEYLLYFHSVCHVA